MTIGGWLIRYRYGGRPNLTASDEEDGMSETLLGTTKKLTPETITGRTNVCVSFPNSRQTCRVWTPPKPKIKRILAAE